MTPHLLGRFLSDTSQFGERELVDTLLASIKTNSDYVVDIGASDGIYASNTYHLFQSGMIGVAIEYDPAKFARLAKNYQNFKVCLFREKVAPANITDILLAAGCPPEPMYLNLDIDSYDYYVLESVLKEYRPSLITAEINETIPPDIDFRVLPSSDVVYTPGSHFYGMSISALHGICNEYDYDLIALNYVNAFLTPKEQKRNAALTPRYAYECGYWHKPDRKRKFPGNADVDNLHDLPTDIAMNRISQAFEKYKMHYRMSGPDDN
jgi:hypothetical protein